MPPPLKIVQIGYDDTVFRKNAPSDTLERQIHYGQLLSALRAESTIQNIILTNNYSSSFVKDNVSFCTVSGNRISRWFNLRSFLRHSHKRSNISVIATQTVLKEALVSLQFGNQHKVPVVGQLHFDIFSKYAQNQIFGRGILGILNEYIAWSAIRRMRALRVVGTDTRNKLVDLGYKLPIHVLPVAVSMPPCKNENFHQRGLRVLFVGRLAAEKNLETWLQVACLVLKEVPDAIFDIVGDGPERVHLQHLANIMGLENSVHFHGFVEYGRLKEYYSRACIFLLTSHYEGFGRVLVEAALHQVPSVASRIGGTSDIVIDGKSGYLCEPNDAVGMALRVTSLLKDHVACKAFGCEAEAHVRSKFDPQTLAKKWVEMLIDTAE